MEGGGNDDAVRREVNNLWMHPDRCVFNSEVPPIHLAKLQQTVLSVALGNG